MSDSADGWVWLWRQGSGIDLVGKLRGRDTVQEGIAAGDDGVLIRSANRPDQVVPWPEIERFELVSRGGGDAISIIRSNAGPLLVGRFRNSSYTRGRYAPVLKASQVQRALEHERVKAIRAARRSARADDVAES